MPTTLYHVILRMYISLWQNPQFYNTGIYESIIQLESTICQWKLNGKRDRNKLIFYHLKQALCKLYHFLKLVKGRHPPDFLKFLFSGKLVYASVCVHPHAIKNL